MSETFEPAQKKMKTAHVRKSIEEQLKDVDLLKEEFQTNFSSSLPIKKDDSNYQKFREFYNSAFSKIAGSEKKIGEAVAVKAWNFLLEAYKLQHTELWLEFISKHYHSGINKDAWTMSLDFLETTDKDFSNHTSSSFWPVVVDEFVEHVTAKTMETLGKPQNLDSSTKYQNFSSKDTFYNQPKSSDSGLRGEFSGLKNQGATCYLNSFLQAQFMTPEFRSGIYQFDCSLNYKTFPIPYQLQRLFAKLQSTKKKAVSTRALTKSFGWTFSDSFTQHDVQELSHVLFDALEESFTSMKQENLINKLYQGSLIDYVRCQTCNFQSQRSDKYLDISLDIHDVYTLEGALRKFTQPEILSGSSQWKCPKCNKLVDAIKGLTFESFPYILGTLITKMNIYPLVTHLKRFDFNWTLNRRVKLGHKVSFPFILDLQPFKGNNPNPTSNSNSNSTSDKSSLTLEEEKAISILRKRIDRLTEDINSDDNLLQSRIHLVDFWRSDRKKLQKELDTLLEKLQKEGKQIPGVEIVAPALHSATPAKMITKDAEYKEGNYELYSVLVHSGSAMGGHYYAYIKSFEKNKWYNFNDYTVTEIPIQEIERSFGESSDSQHSSTAYVLLYRKIDSSRNINSVPDSKVPDLAKQENKLREKVGSSNRSNIMDIDENIEVGAGKKESGGKSEVSNDERDKPVAPPQTSTSGISPITPNTIGVLSDTNTNNTPATLSKEQPKRTSSEETGVELTTYSETSKKAPVTPASASTSNFYGVDSGDEAEEEEEDDTITVGLFRPDGKNFSTVVSCNGITLKRLLETAKAMFKLSEPLEQIRFRKYHVKARYPLEPVEGEYDQYLIEIGLENNINLYVETRKENEKFPVYDRSVVSFRIILFNEGSLSVPQANDLQVPRGSNLGQLKDCISKKYEVPKSELRIFKILAHGNTVELLGNELRLADDFDLYLGETIHVGYNSLGIPWNPLQKLEYLYGKSLQMATNEVGVGGAAVGFSPAMGDLGGVASLLVGMKHSYSGDRPRPPDGPKEKGIKIKKRG